MNHLPIEEILYQLEAQHMESILQVSSFLLSAREDKKKRAEILNRYAKTQQHLASLLASIAPAEFGETETKFVNEFAEFELV